MCFDSRGYLPHRGLDGTKISIIVRLASFSPARVKPHPNFQRVKPGIPINEGGEVRQNNTSVPPKKDSIEASRKYGCVCDCAVVVPLGCGRVRVSSKASLRLL